MVMTQTRTATDPAESAPDDHRPGGRWAQWWASWRVAVRMARRDARRHPGRSALIALLVALPVVALVGGVVLYATNAIDEREEVAFTLGGAQASLFVVGDRAAQQLPTGSLNYRGTTETPAEPIDGLVEGAEAPALARLTGGEVAPVTNALVQVEVAGRVSNVAYLGLDGRTLPPDAGRARLLTGRWPAAPDEVLVTPTGVAQGLPGSGIITMLEAGFRGATGDDSRRVLRVVGTGDGFTRTYSSVGRARLIGLPLPEAPRSTEAPEFLLHRAEPVTLDEIRRWNAHGLHVISKAVVLDPPGDAPGFLSPSGIGEDNLLTGYAALLGVGLLLLTSLLAGPAFAVSAARQRRTLALAASNGADRRQLRRTVLGQALVLGLGATAAALSLGLAASWVLVQSLRRSDPGAYFGPFDVPWLPVALIVLAATASSMVSALLPARGLGRLDIVGVLRGQSVSPRLRRRVPLVGVVVAGAGAVLTLWSAASHNPNAMAAGSAALVLGTLLVVPLVLMFVARVTRRAPVSVRMATSDAARQRARATPAVAAVLAGAAALSTIVVVVASDTALQEKTYSPSTIAGMGYIESADSGLRIAEIARGAAPEVRVSQTRGLADPVPVAGPGTEPGEVRIDAVRSGCSPEQTATTMDADPASGPHCASLSNMPYGHFGRIVAAEPGYLSTLLDLSSSERAALEAGSLIVVDGPGQPAREIRIDAYQSTFTQPTAQVDVMDGVVRFVRNTVLWTDTGPRLESSEEVGAIRALAIDRDRFVRAYPNRDVGAVTTPATLASLGSTRPFRIALDVPGRGITGAEEEAIGDALAAARLDAHVYVERGFRRGDLVVVLSAFGISGFIMLVAALIATALAQAEGQAMSSTLAAVGATRLTRRNLAAAQAGALALIGAGLGATVGVIPGIAVAWQSTGRDWSALEQGMIEPTIVVPWLQLAAPVLVVPLLAALLAWVSIRRAPVVTRRLT